MAGLGNILTMCHRSQDDELLTSVLSMDWDAIYIDTIHHYTQTRLELEIYAGQVARDNTLIFLHDASEFARGLDLDGQGGVKRAILEWLAAHPDWDGEICEPPAYPQALLGLGVLWKR